MILNCALTHVLAVYGSKADYAAEFDGILEWLAQSGWIPAGIVCFDAWKNPDDISHVLHFPGKCPPETRETHRRVVYTYPETSSAAFTVPGHPDFKISSAGVAHTRSLTYLKKRMNGPYFDLEKIWDEHTYFEFGDRSVEKTMATMVQEPYVNHVPTVSSSPCLPRTT